MKLCRACSVVLTDDNARWRRGKGGRDTRDTVCLPCWNKRKRDIRRAARGLSLDAPSAVLRGEFLGRIRDQRVCAGPCGRDLPAVEFGVFTYEGKLRQRATCRDCRNAWKRQRWAETHPQRPARAPRPAPVPRQPRVKVERPAPAQPRPARTHLCEGGCGEVLSTSAARCKECKRARASLNALRTDGSLRKRHNARLVRELAAGKIPGLMWIGEEAWLMGNLCTGCGKAVWDGSKCYSCSVGRPRSILRPEERQAAEVAA